MAILMLLSLSSQVLLATKPLPAAEALDEEKHLEMAAVTEYPKEPEATFEGFTLHIKVNETGSLEFPLLEVAPFSLELPAEEGEEPVTLELEGALRAKNLSADRLEAFMGSMGFQADLAAMKQPVLQPEQLQVLVENGLQSIAIQKESHGDTQDISSFLNGVRIFQGETSDEMVDLFLEHSVITGPLMSLVQPIVYMDKATIIMELPSKEEVKIGFEDQIQPERGLALNRIRVGATVSGTEEAGAVLSVAGFRIANLNPVLSGLGSLPIWDKLVYNPLALLESEEVVVKGGRNGLGLDDGNGHWARLSWDKEGRGEIYDCILPAAFDLMELAQKEATAEAVKAGEKPPPPLISPQMTEAITKNLELVEGILPFTEVEFRLHNHEGDGDVGKDLPVIKLQQPLKITVMNDARLVVNDVPFFPTVFITEALEPVGFVAVGLRNGELRTNVLTHTLPVLYIGDEVFGTLAEALTENLTSTISTTLSLLGPAVNTPNITSTITSTAQILKMVDPLVENLWVECVTFGLEGNELEPNLDYVVTHTVTKTEELGAKFVPRITLGREDGNIGIGDPKKGGQRLTALPGVAAEPLTTTVKQILDYIPGGIQLARVELTPEEAVVLINGERLAGVEWNDELRGNSIQVIDSLKIPELELLDLVASFFPGKDLKSILTQTLLEARLGFEIAVEDEVPPGFLETLLERLQLLQR